MYEAVSTFHAVLDDGTERTVNKGELVADNDPLVIRDQDTTDGRPPGQLFRKVL